MKRRCRSRLVVAAICTLACPVTLAVTSPSFYVYNLPEHLRLSASDTHGDRNTGLVLEKLLRDTGRVTHVARHADFFLLPCYPMGAQESYDTFRAALEYVQHELPYWNATRGANHVVVGSWDFGLMQLAGLPAFERVVQLHHFGWVNASAPWQVTADGRCRFKDGEQCARLSSHLGPLHGVHRPAVDVIVPDVFEPQLKTPASPPVERTTAVFFAGSDTNIHRDDVVSPLRGGAWLAHSARPRPDARGAREGCILPGPRRRGLLHAVHACPHCRLCASVVGRAAPALERRASD